MSTNNQENANMDDQINGLDQTSNKNQKVVKHETNNEMEINIYEIDKRLSESINESNNNSNNDNTGQNQHASHSYNELEQEHVLSESDAHKRQNDNIDESSKRQRIENDKPQQAELGENQTTNDGNLELEFEKAIEKHHGDLSASPEGNEPQVEAAQQQAHGSEQQSQQTQSNKDDKPSISVQINEKEDLQMIASELEQATESNKTSERNNEKPESSSTETVYHDGITVPANSELLNTNTAFAAYNALSSQLPPLAVLANAHLAALPLPIIAPDYLPPRIQLLINTLPTLDNLSTQLLRIVAIGPYQKIVDLASNPDTPAGATYRDLTSLFEFTKRLYSEEDPFLTVEHLAPGMWKEGDKTPSMFRNREQSIESTLRKVNLATFLAATLGTIEVGFFYLNESFLDIFCPANNLDPANALSNMHSNNMSLQSGINTTIGDKVGKLLKPQAVLYLDLKTQAYISAIEAGERSREEILEDILPSNLEEILLSRRGTKVLSPTELDFIDRCKSRKDILLNYPDDKNLGEEYEWFAFLKDLFDYVSKNMGFLIWGKKGRNTREKINHKDIIETPTPHSQEILHSATSIQTSSPAVLSSNTTTELRNQEISDITSALLPSEIQEQQLHLRINPSSTVRNLQRRPWTREEEKALRHALELKGPSWSTILELFGNGGKISEALKNRTQVQLKDKARNWKMFFLKSGLPVPNYLQKVTGDLERDDRSRANKRANRNRKTSAAPVPNPTHKK